MMMTLGRYGGLILSPAAWAISTQLGQILPYGDCSTGAVSTAIMTFAAAVVAAGAALLSWRQRDQAISRPERVITRVAALSGFGFTFALILQGAATVLLSACLH